MRIIVDAKGQRIIGQNQPQRTRQRAHQPNQRKNETAAQTQPKPTAAPVVSTTPLDAGHSAPAPTIPTPVQTQPTGVVPHPVHIHNRTTAPPVIPLALPTNLNRIDRPSIQEKHIKKQKKEEKVKGEEKEEREEEDSFSREKENDTRTRGNKRMKQRDSAPSWIDDGYNSSDESMGRKGKATSPENEKAFEEDLKRNGFIIVRMGGDGNCLFRSIAHQVYGDPEMHDEVRKLCMAYMEKERDHYSQFVSEDFDDYIARKKKDKVYGNNMEIQAITEIFNRPIEVYAYGQKEPINIFHGNYHTDNPPMRLSYHHGNHYNSVIDPKNPSVGVGLGMPGLKPGLADQLQIETAVNESVEESLLAESKRSSDWEMTERELEEAILRQSEQDYWNSLIEQQFTGGN